MNTVCTGMEYIKFGCTVCYSAGRPVYKMVRPLYSLNSKPSMYKSIQKIFLQSLECRVSEKLLEECGWSHVATSTEAVKHMTFFSFFIITLIWWEEGRAGYFLFFKSQLRAWCRAEQGWCGRCPLIPRWNSAQTVPGCLRELRFSCAWGYLFHDETMLKQCLRELRFSCAWGLYLISYMVT